MRKKIIFLLIFIFVFTLVVATPMLAEDNENETSVTATEQATSSLEKIISPDQIPLFRNIIKRGKDLYGVRLKTQINADAKLQVREEQKNRILEKIPAPQFVGMYENVRQVGNALWGYRKDNYSENKDDKILSNQNIADRLEELKTEIHIQSPSDLSMFTNIRKTADGKMFGILKDLKNIPEKYQNAIKSKEFSPITEMERTCVVEAISEKDEALQANNSQFINNLNNSIEVRSKCQVSALNQDEVVQKEAFLACNREFQASQEQFKEQAREEQELVWKNYKEALVKCRPQSSTSTPIIIEDGGINIY
ncbi:MAG: hypothetical protein PWQ35_107 [Patescibacteria group bacterium]|nr:hypothetical protein [Patescibacteria group bacterium]